MKIYRFNPSKYNKHYYFINKKSECLQVLYYKEDDPYFKNNIDTEFYTKNPFDLNKLEEITMNEVPQQIMKSLSFISNDNSQL